MPARRDGASQWRFRYRTKFEDLYGYSNGPRASPVIDGDRVFTVGAEGKLHCLDLETGDVVRKQDFWIKYGVTQEPFGMASTPLVEGGLLVVNVGGPRRACVVGLDTATGREAWRAGTCGPSYASPIPATVHGQPRLRLCRRPVEPAGQRSPVAAVLRPQRPWVTPPVRPRTAAQIASVRATRAGSGSGMR